MGSEGSKEDADDEQAAVQGKAFTFWESDPVRKGEDALVDYARLSVRRKVELDPDSRVALRIKGGWWEAHRRLNVKGDFAGQIPLGCTEDGKLQFCNSKAVDEQLLLIDSADPRISLSGLGDTKEVPHDLLSGRETELLFRCVPWADGTPGCRAPTVEIGEILPTGAFSPLNEAKIEIHPFKELSSMLTLRESSAFSTDWKDPHYQVASDAQEVPGWASLSPKLDSARNVTLIVHGYAVHHEEFTVGTQQTPSEFETIAKRLYWAGHPILEAQDNARVVGVSWPGDIPGAINPYIQALLGTDEVRPYFIEDEFNAFLSGIPLGRRLTQLRSGPEGRKVDILAHSLGNLVVNSALQRVAPGDKPINYVMYQAAVPSDAFLQQYDPLSVRDSVPGVADLVDHAYSLGFPDPRRDRATVDWKWLDQENEVFQKLGEFPGQWACPREEPFEVWVDPDCQDPEVSKPQPAWKCDGSRCQNATRFFRGFAAVDSGLNPVATDFGSAPTRPSYFNTRWSQFGRNSNGSLQSAWTTLFEASMISTSNVRVFNAYNRGDYVLRIDRPYHEGLPVVLLMIQAGVEPVSIPFIVAQLHSSTFHAWKTAQMLGKPFASQAEYGWNAILADIGRGGAGDDLSRQKWWTLEIDGRPSPWKTSENTPAWVLALTGGDRQWIRRRAELAMWYPALAPPAGIVPLDALRGAPGVSGLDVPSQGGNIDLTSVGADDRPNSKGTPSHSYMTMKKFYEVWKGFRAFRTAFEQ